MKLTDKPLSPCCCPNCGKGGYQKRSIAWLGIEIMLCKDCGYAAPVPPQPDPRLTHITDNRQVRPK